MNIYPKKHKKKRRAHSQSLTRMGLPSFPKLKDPFAKFRNDPNYTKPMSLKKRKLKSLIRKNSYNKVKSTLKLTPFYFSFVNSDPEKFLQGEKFNDKEIQDEGNSHRSETQNQNNGLKRRGPRAYGYIPDKPEEVKIEQKPKKAPKSSRKNEKQPPKNSELSKHLNSLKSYHENESKIMQNSLL